MEILVDIGIWNLIGLFGIVMIGLPHGALDGAVAMHLGLVGKFSKLAKFIFYYVIIAVLVVGVWLLIPTVSLIAFLIISILHFGSGDANNGQGVMHFIQSLAHGGLVIIGISQFHRSEVDEIFYYLTNQNTEIIWLVIDIMTVGVVLAIIACITQIRNNSAWTTTSLELLGLGFVYWLAPPLLGFAVYFCLVHSARHFKRIFSSIKQTLTFAKMKNQAILFSAVCWITAVIAFWQLADFSNPEPVIMRITFIGLAALTVPHMILIDGIMNLRENKIPQAVS